MPLSRREALCYFAATSLNAAGRPALANEAATDISAEAYVWGYPVVDMYAILHGQALDSHSAEFKAPPNAVGHARSVATPSDTLVIAPNVDTVYSHAWLDLRGGPVVITVPSFEPYRYLSLQLFDLYTWIIDYVSPRTNGNTGGEFLVVPPGWTGVVPSGIRKVFESTTTLALGMYRTQWFGADDLPGVHALQNQMRVRTLSEYLGQPRGPDTSFPPLIKPLNLRQQPTDPHFFDVLNWMLNFMPVLGDEQNLRSRLRDFGVAPGLAFTSASSSRTAEGEPQAARQSELSLGMSAALKSMIARSRQVRSSAELFGSRTFLKQDYLVRAVGAMLGILGNAAEEYLGLGYRADADGEAFDGQRSYRIRFAPGQLPPVDAFWSITAYTEQKLLYANPIGRYVINSLSVADMVRDKDGGITLLVQHNRPEEALVANWLPVPSGPFGLTFRSYLPRAEIREGRWRAPPVVAIKPV